MNDPNVPIRIFRKRWSLILGCFFPVIIRNAGPSEKFFTVDHPKQDHNEREFKG